MPRARWWFLLAVSLLVLGAPPRAEAAMMSHYDLSGLLLQADAVVIADRIGSAPSGQGEALGQYRVVRSLRGSRKPGEVVAVYDRGYATTGHAIDARAVLFLDTHDGQPQLVASGLRVLEAGKVWRFEQHSNPGPYVMVPQGKDPVDQWGLGGAQLDLAGLERAIAAAQQRIDALAAAKSIADPAKRRAAVLALFTVGARSTGFYVDLLAARARTQLAAAGDLEGALLVDLRDHGATFRADDFAKLPDLVALARDPARAASVRVAALHVAGRGFGLASDLASARAIAALIDDPDPDVRAAAISAAATPAQTTMGDRAKQAQLDAEVARIRTAVARRFATEQEPGVLAAILAAYDSSFRKPPPSRTTGPRLVAIAELTADYLDVDVFCVRPSRVTDSAVIVTSGATRVPTGGVNVHVRCTGSTSTGGGSGAPPVGRYGLAVELAVAGAGKVTLPLGTLIVEPSGERRLER